MAAARATAMKAALLQGQQPAPLAASDEHAERQAR
jgi:hypothetical protein